MHGPRHSLEECELLKEYSKKYALQQSHEDIEVRSGGKIRHNKTVNSDSSFKESNIMKRDALILKKKGKKLTKKRKNESTKADQEGVENTYGIDHLTIGEATHGLDES